MKTELDTDHAGGHALSADRSLCFRDLLLSSNYPEMYLSRQFSMLPYFLCYINCF